MVNKKLPYHPQPQITQVSPVYVQKLSALDIGPILCMSDILQTSEQTYSGYLPSEIRVPNVHYWVIFPRDICHHGYSATISENFAIIDCTDFYDLLNQSISNPPPLQNFYLPSSFQESGAFKAMRFLAWKFFCYTRCVTLFELSPNRIGQFFFQKKLIYSSGSWLNILKISLQPKDSESQRRTKKSLKWNSLESTIPPEMRI